VIRADAITVAARPQTGQNYFAVVINGRDLVVGEVPVPGNALAFDGVNALHFACPATGAEVMVLAHGGYFPLVPATGAFNHGHSVSVSKANPRRSGGCCFFYFVTIMSS